LSNLLRTLLIVIGTLSVGLGMVGVFVPVLPTTPFLLLGAACYARSSRRFYDWLLSRRHLGQYIRDYRDGRGIPLLTKVVVLALLWGTIIYSVLFVIGILAIRILLLCIAIAVSVHVLRLPTLRQIRRALNREGGPIDAATDHHPGSPKP